MMKSFLTKNKTWLFPATFVVMLVALGLIWLGLNQTVTIVLDGELLSVRTSALTVRGALRTAGVSVTDADRVSPSRTHWLWNEALIQVERAREVLIRTPEEDIQLISAESIPANLLQEAGVALYPHDRIRLNGEIIDPGVSLDKQGGLFLQYQPAAPITLVMGEEEITFHTGEATLGAALEAAGIQIGEKDRLDADLSSVIDGALRVTVQEACEVTVSYQGDSVTGLTAAETVGGALLDLNISLQNMDYSIPNEEDAIPDNREITVIQVNEEILVMTDEIQFTYDYIEDPNAVLDDVSVVESGQIGINATRERIQYANGEEIGRITEDMWQASEPKNGVLSYGSNIVVQTEVVDGITIEYWRKIEVYATSYKPCDDEGNCHYGTSTGLMMVKKGSIAVTQHWLEGPSYGGLNMWGLSVYVAGYGKGTIADSTYYSPGYPWIDLGYSEEDYVAWHAWTTMYFLTPIPSDYIPLVIYP